MFIIKAAAITITTFCAIYITEYLTTKQDKLYTFFLVLNTICACGMTAALAIAFYSIG